jgi:hypothetical protein
MIKGKVINGKQKFATVVGVRVLSSTKTLVFYFRWSFSVFGVLPSEFLEFREFIVFKIGQYVIRFTFLPCLTNRHQIL